MLGPMLLTWHNVQYYQDLMRGLREAIRRAAGRHAAELQAAWAAGDAPPEDAAAAELAEDRETCDDRGHHRHLRPDAARPQRRQPASPEAAMLERVPNPHPGMPLSRALHLRRSSPRSARSPASRTSRIW